MKISFSKLNQSGRQRGVGFAFLLAAFLGSCVTTELRAQVIVVPNSLATNDGDASATSVSGAASVRWLQIYDASQFGALSRPSFLTKFAYRPDQILNQSGPRSLTLRVYVSTTSRSVADLSTTFAENLGTNNTLVFDGTVNLKTGNLPGPGNTRQFDYVFPFTTPFLYDPAAGNLVLSLQIEASGSVVTFDTESADPATERVFGSPSTADTGSILVPHVTQFTFEAPPLVTPTFSNANWSIMGGIAGADKTVSEAVVDGSGNLYIGGTFTIAGEVIPNYVAKWNGSSWSALGSGLNGSVSALAVSGGDLYAGGYFTTAGGSPGNYIAKWNGSSWSALGSGMSGEVRALAVSGNDLYAAGGFSTAGGKVSVAIARAYLPALPTLSVLRTGESVTVSWPTVDTAGFALEQAGPLAAPAGWVTNSSIVTDDGAHKSVTLPATKSSQFFRLRRP